jgi:hypothetical protein
MEPTFTLDEFEQRALRDLIKGPVPWVENSLRIADITSTHTIATILNLRRKLAIVHETSDPKSEHFGTCPSCFGTAIADDSGAPCQYEFDVYVCHEGMCVSHEHAESLSA